MIPISHHAQIGITKHARYRVFSGLTHSISVQRSDGLRDMRRRGAFCLYWDSNAYALPVFFIDREESVYHN